MPGRIVNGRQLVDRVRNAPEGDHRSVAAFQRLARVGLVVHIDLDLPGVNDLVEVPDTGLVFRSHTDDVAAVFQRQDVLAAVALDDMAVAGHLNGIRTLNGQVVGIIHGVAISKVDGVIGGQGLPGLNFRLGENGDAGFLRIAFGNGEDHICRVAVGSLAEIQVLVLQFVIGHFDNGNAGHDCRNRHLVRGGVGIQAHAAAADHLKVEKGPLHVVVDGVADDLGDPPGINLRRLAHQQLLEVVLEPQVVLEVIGNFGRRLGFLRIGLIPVVGQGVDGRFGLLEQHGHFFRVFGVFNRRNARFYQLPPQLTVFVVLLRQAVVGEVFAGGMHPLVNGALHIIQGVAVAHGVVELLHDQFHQILGDAVGNAAGQPARGLGGPVRHGELLHHIVEGQRTREETHNVLAQDVPVFHIIGPFLGLGQILGDRRLVRHLRRRAAHHWRAKVTAIAVGGELQPEHVAVLRLIPAHADVRQHAVDGVHPAGHAGVVKLAQPFVIVFFQFYTVFFQILLHIAGQAGPSLVHSLDLGEVEGVYAAVLELQPGLLKGPHQDRGAGVALIEVHQSGLIEVPLAQGECLTGQNYLPDGLRRLCLVGKNHCGSR